MKKIILILLTVCWSMAHAQVTTNTDTTSTGKNNNNQSGVIPTNPNTSGPENTVNQTLPDDDDMNNKNNMNAMSWKSDTTFAMKAADDGMLEVKLAKFVLTKSTSKSVKSFAQMMVDDHSKANTELKALAKKKGITLSPSLSKKSQDAYDQLSKKSADMLDKEYIKMMVKEHEKAVDMFESAAKNAGDNEIRTWAAGKLPTLKHHLQMAKDMDKP